jgi:hypothetical protein
MGLAAVGKIDKPSIRVAFRQGSRHEGVVENGHLITTAFRLATNRGTDFAAEAHARMTTFQGKRTRLKKKKGKSMNKKETKAKERKRREPDHKAHGHRLLHISWCICCVYIERHKVLGTGCRVERSFLSNDCARIERYIAWDNPDI